ncbi:septal ring lytic transglycosylase RlpA family protein, partial [Agrobacterium sp. S2]|nr:septal ring lytic transglycosylase RlpA family protein [Agrobacterium sp. S2]
DMKATGTANVRVQYAGRAPLDGHDMPYLMASYIPKGSRSPGVAPEGQIATGVMVASASPNFVPAPTSNPNYAGSAQTALVGSKKNAALQAMPLVNGVQPAFEQFAILPEIGPILAERPAGNFLREPAAPGGNYLRVPTPSSKYAAAYSEESAAVSKTAKVFDTVLVNRDGLSEESILAHVKRQQAKSR